MNLTKEQLTEIETLAALPGLTNDEIAIICDIDPKIFQNLIQNPQSELFKAYHKGKLLSKAQLAKKIKTLSDQGSGPAQVLQEKLNRLTETKNLYNEYAKSERS